MRSPRALGGAGSGVGAAAGARGTRRAGPAFAASGTGCLRPRSAGVAVTVRRLVGAGRGGGRRFEHVSVKRENPFPCPTREQHELQARPH